jgi:hypothetical protein
MPPAFRATTTTPTPALATRLIFLPQLLGLPPLRLHQRLRPRPRLRLRLPLRPPQLPPPHRLGCSTRWPPTTLKHAKRAQRMLG